MEIACFVLFMKTLKVPGPEVGMPWGRGEEEPDLETTENLLQLWAGSRSCRLPSLWPHGPRG